MRNVSIKVFRISLIVCFFSISYAQGPSFHFAKSIGGSAVDETKSITADPSGNIVTTGFFNGVCDFDPTAGTEFLVSAGGPDIFITKSDPDGELIWSKRIGGMFQEEGEKICTDATGNIYVSGYFTGTVDFDPGPGVFNLTSALFNDVFILKLDPNGEFLWAGNIAGSSHSECNELKIDDDGNVYLFGYFQGTQDFDPGVGVHSVSVNVSQDAFLLKLASDGSFIWCKELAGDFACFGESMDISSDAIVLSGHFMGSCDFDPGASTVPETSLGGKDAFIVSLDTDGDYQWSKILGGLTDVANCAVAIYTDGSVYSTGNFQGTVDFDPCPIPYNMSSAGSDDIYISKLDANGDFVWAYQMGGTSEDQATSIATDASGDVFVAGNFRGTADFDPTTLVLDMTSAGQTDGFITKLDSDGFLLWADQFGGNQKDEMHDLVITSTNDMLTSGFFQTTVNFGFDGSSVFLGSAGSYDGFFQKGGQCLPTTTNLTVTSCEEYLSPSGSTYWTTSGIYTETLTGVSGCDSVVTIDLTIEPLVATVTLNSDELIADQAGANYQWIDCSDNSIISGATSQNFFPTEAGDYAVIIDNGDCSDTSECVHFTPLGLSDEQPLSFKIWPNPSDGNFNLSNNQNTPNARYQVKNIQGKLVQEGNLSANGQTNLSLQSPEGIYLLIIETEEAPAIQHRLIIQ